MVIRWAVIGVDIDQRLAKSKGVREMESEGKLEAKFQPEEHEHHQTLTE